MDRSQLLEGALMGVLWADKSASHSIDLSHLPIKRWRGVLLEDLEGLHPRLRLLGLLELWLPHFAFNRLRTSLYRMAGFRIGRGTMVFGHLECSGQGRIWEKLVVGERCQLTSPLYLDLMDHVTIGDDVAIAHHVKLITTNHQFGAAHHRCGAMRCAPIVIGNGVWIGAAAIILPGVTIGAGSVVAAGAVVTKSVEPNILVGGVPARLMRQLPMESSV